MAGFQAGAGHQADKESLSRARPGKSPWFQKGAVSHQCFANGQASAKFCAPCSGLLAASCKIFPEVKFVSQMALQSWILAERFAAGAGKSSPDLLGLRLSHGCFQGWICVLKVGPVGWSSAVAQHHFCAGQGFAPH